MRAVEVFSCSGGMAEGFRRSGITFDLAFDADPDACDSYEKNLGHRPVQMDVRDLLRLLDSGWNAGDVDLLVADPPCTPWSRAGKRAGLDDERDMLRETVALIRELRPLAYLIGNVPGLDDGCNLDVVQGTIGSLGADGCVRDFARLDAANYGVPQHRVRPFWFGHLGGECIVWPVPTHCDPRELDTVHLPGCDLRPWVTCRDALAGVPAEQLGRPVRLRWRGQNSAQHGSIPDKPARVVGTSNLSDGNVLVTEATKRKQRNPGKKARVSVLDEPAGVVTTRENGDGNQLAHVSHRTSDLDRPARTLTKNTHSDGALLTHPRHPINVADEPSYTLMSKGDGRGAQGACALEWPWPRPSTTVTSRAGLPPPGHHPESGSILSQPGAIVLSERAAARLQGFADGWHFCGKTKRARWGQLGMAMPPPLAYAVATSVVRWFEKASRAVV